jgi:repressor LexA
VVRVMARSGSSSGADPDLDSADPADAAAGPQELITRLTRRRAASGLSQAGVARLMRTSQSAVARLESGQHDAQLSTVTRYAGALGLSLDLVEDSPGQAGDSGAGSGGAAAEVPVALEPAAVAGMADEPGSGDVLTWRQQRVLQAISDYVQRHGYAPSMREIGEAVGLASTSSVSFQLSALQRKGYLRRDAGWPRGVETSLPRDPAARPGGEIDDELRRNVSLPETAYVPLVGRIAAGGPIVSEESVEEILPLSRSLVGEGTLFLLRVVGDAMVGAAIADGDLVVIRRQPEACNGDIVAAMIEGEATVKTFRRSDDHVWLMPQNPAYTPILGDQASILGRVVAVLRKV